MAYGIQLLNPNGTVFLDSSYRTGKILGTIVSGTSNGSFTPTGSFDGTIFAFAPYTGIFPPGIWVTNNVIYWAFSYSDRSSVDIFYGCF